MKKELGKLVIARHHESEWNKLGKWTGKTEVHLSPEGLVGAEKMGEIIKDIHFDYIFTSTQIRAKETLNKILSVRNENLNIPTIEAKELNERDYGDYTGKNKWEMENVLGHDEFIKIRRSFDCPIPNGESLKMVYERSVPFFIKEILPLLNSGKDILIVAHGNSLRSIMKYIENISDEDISNVEMPFGSFIIYHLSDVGHMLDKEVKEVK